MNARESTTFEDIRAPDALKEGEAQQHNDARAKPERMTHECRGIAIGGIRDDAVSRRSGRTKEIGDRDPDAVID